MDLDTLKAELLAGHPDTGPYDTDDAVAANQLNVVNRTRNRIDMSGDEVFQQTEATEFAALSPEKRQLWLAFCSRDQIDTSAVANVAFVQYVFGAGSTTVSNLSQAREEDISRAVELELGVLAPGHVENARY